VEVKRAFRKYLGPDDPGPFMDMINSMSFGCRHMKEYNRRGVFTLTRKTANGEVRVMRVNDVDHIWTKLRVLDLIIAQSAKTPYIYFRTLAATP